LSNLKRGIKYLSITIGVVVLLYFEGKAQIYLRQLSDHSYNVMYNLAGMTFLPVIFGLILAIPQLVRRTKKTGSWKYDWVKFIFIGLPAITVAMFPIHYFFTPLGHILPMWFMTVFNASPHQFCFAGGTVFGYILIHSLEKTETD